MIKAAEFFLKNLRFTMMVTFFIGLAGYMSFSRLNSESFPNVNLGKVVILTSYRGAATEDVESKITKPLEEEIRSVSGLKRVRSISQPGVSTITTEVDIDNYDVETVVADLQRAVDSTSELPTDLEEQPEFIEIKVDEMPIIEVSVVGGETSYKRNEVAFMLSEELTDNKKISTVSYQGYQEPQFRIQLDLKKLEQYYISIKEVINAVQSTTVSIPAGFIENDEEKFLIKIDGKLTSAETLAQIAVRTSNSGEKVLLGQVSEITLDNEKARERVFLDGEEATNLVIAKKASEDIIELSNEIKKTLKSYEEKYPEYKFTIYNNEGLRVEKRLNVLYSNALAGLVLVVFFLLVFLSGRAGIMTAFSLPLAILGTLIYMQTSGMSLNSITIMALIISIGMLVDNAVVISENFMRLTDDGKKPLDAALESIKTLWAPVTATALTTIAAFLPMMVTKGIMGEFIIGIPLVVTASLLFSLFESFFFLPARLVLTAKEKTEEEEKVKSEVDWFTRVANKFFKPFMVKCIKHRVLTMFTSTLLIISSLVFMGVFNKFILFPANQTEIYMARVEMKQGTPLSLTDKNILTVSQKIKEKLGKNVKNIVANSGNSMTDWSDPKGKRADSVAILKIFMTNEAKNKLQTEAVLKDLRSIKLDTVDRLSFEAMVNGPPVGDPLTLRIRSSNDDELENATQELMERLGKLKGLVGLRVNQQYTEPEIRLKVDTIKAQSLGVTLGDVGFTFQTAFSGIPVNDVNINNRDVDYFVELSPENKSSVEDIMKMEVLNRFGKLIPVQKFSELKETDSRPFIERYDYKRTKTITSDVETQVVTSIEANAYAEEEFKKVQEKYPSVSLVFGGEAENTAESMESLSQAMILALIGIFALLILVFNSYTTPFIVLSTIPLGLIGVAYAFFLQGLPISFLAMIGIVGLSGIIVNSGIVLISFIEDNRKENKEKSVPDDLVEILANSSVVRLKAVVITSLTTISGLLPTAYGVGGSDDFISPMAMSISWGLVSGTILTLIWVPCAYMITHEVVEKTKSLFQKKKSLKQTESL